MFFKEEMDPESQSLINRQSLTAASSKPIEVYNTKQDIDLDDGKTCCCCCGLQFGYNILGGLSFITSFFAVVAAIVKIPTLDPIAIPISMIFAAWVVIYSTIWLQGYLAKKRGEMQLFRVRVSRF